MKRIEHDPYGGWIARGRSGGEIGGEGFRWNSRSVARTVVWEADTFGDLAALRSKSTPDILRSDD